MALELNHPSMFIGGISYAPDRELRTYLSPTTGEPVSAVMLGTADDVDRAVAAARGALPALTDLTLDGRAELLKKTADAIRARAEDFAALLAVEHGKPYYTEALAQVEGSAAAMAEGGA